jgi:predicted alpha/beta-fold hydrolase
MTLAAWIRRRRFPLLPAPEARLIRVAPDTQVLAHCYWQPDASARPTLLALHGLEGSSLTHYMRGLADKAWRRGWNAVLLNQRTCGGTENLTPGLYHSGLTADPISAIETLAAEKGLRDFGVIGYSLGGNLTMKLAAEMRDHPGLPVRAVAAICPTIDLERCVRAIERPRNLPYQFNFVRSLKARMRRRDRIWPGTFDLGLLSQIWTIRKFDDVYTAPYHGFGDARNYYARASALRTIDRIAVPALIVAAEDDSFVPSGQFDEPAVRDNKWIDVRVSRHGGHCGFITTPAQNQDGYWAEETTTAFLATVMRG